MGGLKTRRLGTALRIYRNSSDDIIAMDDIEVNADHTQLANYSFHRGVGTNGIHIKRNLFHLTASADRVVAIIQVIGDYTSVEDNGGDYLVATWEGTSGNENDVVISLEGRVAQLGDTV